MRGAIPRATHGARYEVKPATDRRRHEPSDQPDPARINTHTRDLLANEARYPEAGAGLRPRRRAGFLGRGMRAAHGGGLAAKARWRWRTLCAVGFCKAGDTRQRSLIYCAVRRDDALPEGAQADEAERTVCNLILARCSVALCLAAFYFFARHVTRG